MQKLVETQDTPPRVLKGVDAVLGSGLVTADQVVPSHISIRANRADAKAAELPAAVPTATQKVVETQDTPLRSWPFVLGLGLGTIDQVVPSHISTRVISVRWGGKPSGVTASPTATQKLVETQDTPLRLFLIVPGLGLGTTDQVVPSHVSTRVALVEAELSSLTAPTAVQFVVETQDSPLRLLANELGLGLGTADQVVPSAPPVSTRVWVGLPLLLYWPTAMQEPTAGHDTPKSS
jgi:hypothetical protein